MKRWTSKSQERQALALLLQQEKDRRTLSPEERDLLKLYFFSVDQESSTAMERLQRSRGTSMTARRLEAKLNELTPLWERLRKAIEGEQKPHTHSRDSRL